jgi:hypothetical protein
MGKKENGPAFTVETDIPSKDKGEMAILNKEVEGTGSLEDFEANAMASLDEEEQQEVQAAKDQQEREKILSEIKEME